MKYYDKQLLSASRLGDLELVRSCLERGASIHCQDEKSMGCSPLHLSVTAGHLKVVEYLLEQGANPEQVDKLNRTALQLALFESYPFDTERTHNLILLLQSHGASFQSAIFKHAYLGQLDLLQRGVTPSEVNQTDTQGYSVLHSACVGGCLETVKALVAQVISCVFFVCRSVKVGL